MGFSWNAVQAENTLLPSIIEKDTRSRDEHLHSIFLCVFRFASLVRFC